MTTTTSVCSPFCLAGHFFPFQTNLQLLSRECQAFSPVRILATKVSIICREESSLAKIVYRLHMMSKRMDKRNENLDTDNSKNDHHLRRSWEDPSRERKNNYNMTSKVWGLKFVVHTVQRTRVEPKSRLRL